METPWIVLVIASDAKPPYQHFDIKAQFFKTRKEAVEQAKACAMGWSEDGYCGLVARANCVMQQEKIVRVNEVGVA